MRYSKTLAVLLLAVIATVGCGGSKSSTGGSNQSNPSSISGSWEATLPNSGGQGNTQYVELNLTQSGETVTATGVQTFVINGNETEYCDPTDSQSLSATLSGSTLSGTITTCFGTATFTGTVANNVSVTGTYSSNNGSGSFSAQTVPPLSGTFAGSVEFQDGTTNQVSVSLSENSSDSITVTGSVTGPDAGSINLTGSVVGNVGIVSGIVSGQAWSGSAWYHAGTLYVVNPSDAFIFTLTAQN